MIRKTLAMMAAMALCLTANATDKQHPPKPQPRPEVTHNQAQASTYSTATAGSSSWANAGGGSSSLDTGNFYVLPAPVAAAPLPANLCPQGDSVAWSIGWNFFSYSRSSTRTEIECLEKVLDVIRANAPKPVAQVLPPLTPAERAEIERLEAPAPVQPVVAPQPKPKAKPKTAAKPPCSCGVKTVRT